LFIALFFTEISSLGLRPGLEGIRVPCDVRGASLIGCAPAGANGDSYAPSHGVALDVE